MGSVGVSKFDVFGEYNNVIDGKLSSTSTTRHGINPATGKELPPVPVATQEDVDAAVAAGQKAFKSWSKTSYEERGKAVCALADALEKHSEDFKKLLSMEQGKPVRLCLYLPFHP